MVVQNVIVYVTEGGGSNCLSLCHGQTTMFWFKWQFKPWLIKYYVNQQQYHQILSEIMHACYSIVVVCNDSLSYIVICGGM